LLLQELLNLVGERRLACVGEDDGGAYAAALRKLQHRHGPFVIQAESRRGDLHRSRVPRAHLVRTYAIVGPARNFTELRPALAVPLFQSRGIRGRLRSAWKLCAQLQSNRMKVLIA